MDLNTFSAVVHSSMDAIHYIHLMACGKSFDRLHNISQDYYEHLQKDYDDIAEQVLLNNINLVHPALTASYIGYNVETVVTGYTLEEGLKRINLILQDLVKSAQEVLEQYQCPTKTGTRVVLENFIEYWSKELEYKMKRRLQV